MTVCCDVVLNVPSALPTQCYFHNTTCFIDILSSCPVSFPCGGPSPSLKEVVTRVIRRHGKRAIADVCAKHLMDEKCYLAAEANLHRLVDVESGIK